MDYLWHFWWLLKMTLTTIVGCYPYNFAVLLLLIITIARQAHPQQEGFKKFIVLNSFPFLIPVLILLIGSIFFDTHNDNKKWIELSLIALGWTHLPICAFLIVKMPERGWLTMAITLAQGWVSLCALLVSFMSVSNDWM